MKALIIYDSVFGNTEKIALAIGNSLNPKEDVKTLKVNNIKLEHLKGLDLLIVGSPTRAFRPTKEISDFIKSIPSNSLNSVKVASFDTRVDVKEVKSGFLNIMVKLFGYAAEPILKKLVKKGGNSVVEPEGFFVNGSEGPLRDGEIERAMNWAKKMI